MGVAIHYRGRLRRPEDIQPFLDELEDICRSAGWEYHRHDFTDPDVWSINFKPHPECDTVTFAFLKDGTTTNFISLQFDPDDPRPWTLAKTQFAGAETHKALCHLLHYLDKHWFETFEVLDDAEYYQTTDEKELLRQINFINKAMDTIADGLDRAVLDEGESISDRILKIVGPLHKKYREGKSGE